MTRSGFVMMLLLAAGPAMAQPIVTLPEGLPGADSEFAPGPDCHGGGSPLGVVRDGKFFMPQPYARDPVVYGGIYLGWSSTSRPWPDFSSPGFRCWITKEIGYASPAPPGMAQSRRII
jgi:hypothetical protein